MNLSCKLALLAIPLNILAVAIVQLEYLYSSSAERINRYFPNDTLLIIAHPDDESMFFGPLALNLVDNGKHLHILCLSPGNSEGSGETRAGELQKLVEVLGPNASVKIINDEQLTDGMDAFWEPNVIAEHVMSYVRGTTTKSGAPIRALVTFDSYGVSGHPNHKQVHEGLMSLTQNSRDLKLKHFYLNSVNILRKYISFMDSIFTCPPRLLSPSFHLSKETPDKDQLVFALNFPNNKRLRHLLSLHESQMVWFRKLYMIFSRFMFINDLTQDLLTEA